MDAKTALKSNIVELRKKIGLSQGELAERIGKSQKTMSEIENGKVWPDHKTIQLIAKGLNVEETDLFTDPNMLHTLKYLTSRK